MSLDGPLDKFLEDEDRKPGDQYVNLTIHHVSSSLLNDFAKFVVQPYYPGWNQPSHKRFNAKSRKRTETKGQEGLSYERD